MRYIVRGATVVDRRRNEAAEFLLPANAEAACERLNRGDRDNFMWVGEAEENCWKDITSYSQGDTERVPRVWEACLGSFTLRVHRHPQLQWLATCHGVFEHFELASENAEEAKCQAVAKLRGELERALRAWLRESWLRESAPMNDDC